MSEDAEAMARAAGERASTSNLSVDDAFHLFAQAARLLESALIVRDMVEEDRNGPLDHNDHCIWCGADRRRLPARGLRLALRGPEPTADHDHRCPWRRAVDWVRDSDLSPGQANEGG